MIRYNPINYIPLIILGITSLIGIFLTNKKSYRLNYLILIISLGFSPFFQEAHATDYKKNQSKIDNNDEVVYLKHDNIKKTIEGQTLDHLGLTKMCCRRHMLTHVDIE